jgi:hypothetical protein
MGNQYQLSLLASAPAAAESMANLDEVNWAFIFVVPSGVSNFLLVGVDQDQASRPQQWIHPSVVQTHVAVEVARGMIE